jgi:Raf kinase inhibitor-like YbhB/YbcL family protein
MQSLVLNIGKRTLLMAVLFLAFFSSAVQAAGFSVSSPAFEKGQSIPVVHTCDGKDLSPPLQWNGIPSGTRSLALIVDDPDAPDPAAPRRVWVHWVLYDLPATSTGLPQAVTTLPPGTREGKNDWHRTGYGGPCPPIGRHRYFFKLFALDTTLPDLEHPSKKQLLSAMQGHILGKAVLVGTYSH